MAVEMRIHTDKLNPVHLDAACEGMPGVALGWTEHASRKRDRAFEVRMVGEPGKDRHGIARKRPVGRYRALTWVEWGDWMVELFKIDPGAIIGKYEGWREFCDWTYELSFSRPDRENAVEHATRWQNELLIHDLSRFIN